MFFIFSCFSWTMELLNKYCMVRYNVITSVRWILNSSTNYLLLHVWCLFRFYLIMPYSDYYLISTSSHVKIMEARTLIDLIDWRDFTCHTSIFCGTGSRLNCTVRKERKMETKFIGFYRVKHSFVNNSIKIELCLTREMHKVSGHRFGQNFGCNYS